MIVYNSTKHFYSWILISTNTREFDNAKIIYLTNWIFIPGFLAESHHNEHMVETSQKEIKFQQDTAIYQWMSLWFSNMITAALSDLNYNHHCINTSIDAWWRNKIMPSPWQLLWVILSTIPLGQIVSKNTTVCDGFMDQMVSKSALYVEEIKITYVGQRLKHCYWCRIEKGGMCWELYKLDYCFDGGFTFWEF